MSYLSEQELAELDKLIGADWETLDKREQAKESCYQFFLQSWDVLEPGRNLESNWHIELICEYLEAVYNREIKNLLINIAPRHMKSTIVSIVYPCWIWLHKPEVRFLCLSYVSNLANGHNYDRRRLIQSDWYQSLSGGLELSFAKNRVSEFGNDHQGQMMARGLDSGVTGAGGEFIIIDDPNDPDKVESEIVRESATKKFKDYSTTRKNSPDAPVVVIQQRTHTLDVSGYILKEMAEDYETLILPTIAPKTYQIRFPVSGREVTREAGSILHPSRISKEQLERDKRALGSMMFSARHQQDPLPEGGGMIKPGWFRRYSALPAEFDLIVTSWDTAQKKGETSKPWSGTTWMVARGNFYLMHVHTERHDYPDGERAVVSLARRFLHGNPHALLIEDKSTGSTLIQRMRMEPEFLKLGLNVIAVEPEGDKVARISGESPAMESGRCWLPEYADWLTDYESALFNCPMGLMDPVDSTSQFLMYMRTHGSYMWLEGLT